MRKAMKANDSSGGGGNALVMALPALLIAIGLGYYFMFVAQ